MNRLAGKKVEKKKKRTAKNKKKKKKKFSFGKFLFKLIVLAAFIFGVAFGYKVYENGGGLKAVVATVLRQDLREERDTINILIMGVSDDISAKLTDTIILCSYNPNSQRASMLSIPRDTFVGKKKENAKGSDKINAMYSISAQRSMETVSLITGKEVNYFVIINNQALIDIVDIIGGVDFDVPIDMDYDDDIQDLHIHLTHGMQRIDGEKAEQLLRFRHNNDGSSYPSEYGDNDYGRMKTQRAFIKEVVKQTLNIKNLPKWKKLLDSIYANIITNVERETIMAYIPYAVEFNTENIDTQQLPGVSEKANEVWFYFHDKEKTKKLIEVMDKRLNGLDVIIPENLIIDESKRTNTNSTTNTTNTTNSTNTINTSNATNKNVTNTNTKNTTNNKTSNNTVKKEVSNTVNKTKK